VTKLPHQRTPNKGILKLKLASRSRRLQSSVDRWRVSGRELYLTERNTIRIGTDVPLPRRDSLTDNGMLSIFADRSMNGPARFSSTALGSWILAALPRSGTSAVDSLTTDSRAPQRTRRVDSWLPEKEVLCQGVQPTSGASTRSVRVVNHQTLRSSDNAAGNGARRSAPAVRAALAAWRSPSTS
jgi:hypothetical protein